VDAGHVGDGDALAEALSMTHRKCCSLHQSPSDPIFSNKATALSSMRCFAVELQQARQDEDVPGSLVLADETMVGWAGATNIHITKFPNKATSVEVCLETLCDAQTRVMCSFEFVERLEKQGHKRYSDLWRVAACMLRLTEPWHNQCPCILPADDWFSWMPTSFALVQEGL
jgi:hypothetical protein